MKDGKCAQSWSIIRSKWKGYIMLWIYIKYEGPAAFDSERCDIARYLDKMPADIKVLLKRLHNVIRCENAMRYKVRYLKLREKNVCFYYSLL